MEILKLQPCGKDYLWGGTRLRDEYGKKIDLTPLAETWECSVHPDGPSVIANGEYRGQTLSSVLKQHPEYLGTKVKNGELPVLVKFIDAKQDLSVQVHPDDTYANKHEGDNGKTEMWYVVESERGAGMYCGFKRKVTKDELADALANGTVTDLLNFIEVKKGDCLFIKSGTVHAICGGVLVYEIQQNSTLTYRLYDYGRVGADGKPRELHIAKALEVTDTQSVCRPNETVRRLSDGAELLGECRYFIAVAYDTSECGGTEVSERSFSAFTCVDGECVLTAGGGSCALGRGDSCFVPAGSGKVRFDGNAVLIEAKV